LTPELVIIAGPTGSGKTALALELAHRWNAEIVGADSQQVYRGFDIGTAKPSAEELTQVRHHLVSVVEPDVEGGFSAALYQKLADAAIADIASRGKRVLVVGGTGLYLRALLHGVVPAPGGDAAFRKSLEVEPSEDLHARLAAVDAETARALPVNDRVRVVRALEIHHLTGTPASEFRRAHAFSEVRYPHRLFVLSPPRAQLYEAIDARMRRMFDGGLLDEVRALVARGFGGAPPMGSVGYAQALACVEGRMSRDEALADAAQKTRHYAKRQLTWFRKEPGACFIEPPYAALRALT
jgi:tRNA dimethylallyltransferase